MFIPTHFNAMSICTLRILTTATQHDNTTGTKPGQTDTVRAGQTRMKRWPREEF